MSPPDFAYRRNFCVAEGAVLVLLLRSTNNDNMRFDLVVNRNGGTAVSPRPPILMCLYSMNLGLAMKFLRFA